MSNAIGKIVLVCGIASAAAFQSAPPGPDPLIRRYRDGEKLTYHMKAVNEKWHYEIQAEGIVKKDAAGTYYEEYRWSDLISDGKKAELSPVMADFRQQLTLDPNHNPTIPDFSKVDLRLIGPITDFLTFYADLWLGKKSGKLVHAGDHFYFKRSAPNSWADGNYVLLGEDAVDFDFTLKAIDREANMVTLVVRHVPPEKPAIKIPLGWMQKPVADAPNNWVQVEKLRNGKYLAAVGKETFVAEIKLSLSDGKVISGTIDNPVETIECECTDAALTQCGEPRPHSIRRQIEISLVR